MTGLEADAAARWARAREVFDAVVVLPAADRDVALAALCGGDAALRGEVVSLLLHDSPDDDAIARLVADAAGDIVGVSSSASADAFPPTSDRYRIVARLGGGGMGDVFLAEDAALGRRVALKVPRGHVTTDATARRRLRDEAHAAAAINHPHVCIVHDVGDGPDGRPFIAMELIEGETLASRLAAGPLPLADVLTLGIQAAAALHAAHAIGVVHRDLKPSNIMWTAHGIKLLDFGLATAVRTVDTRDDGARAPGGFAGTVPYMSPEQVRGEPLDHRTDLFSLGVVLYEAVTGRLPFDEPTAARTADAIVTREPAPPEEIVPGLPSDLSRVLARALAKVRDARYADAATLADDLRVVASTHARPVRRRGHMAVAALAATVLVGAAVASGTHTGWPFEATVRRAAATPPVVRPVSGPTSLSVLVADFSNATGDATFDGTLRESLIVQLQQTPFLRVLPPSSVDETLRQMTRAPGTRLTAPVAAEVAQRRGLAAWISGAIESTRDGLVVTLRVTRTDSGDVVARERVEVRDRDAVLGALGDAAARLRQTLGESQQSIGRFNVPTAQATTASLDALKAYTLGAERSASGDYGVAAALYERAVQIDPEFALAYQALAREQANEMYAHDVVAASATRAYELRTRTTGQERFNIETEYHSSVSGALDRASATAGQWKAAYPADWRPHHVLAHLHYTLGQYAEGVQSGREAVRLNPDVAAAYSNLAGSLFALGRFVEARDVYHEAMARGLDAPEYHAFLWRIAYYTGDTEGMQRQMAWASSSASWASNMPALAAALQGQWATARSATQLASAGFARRRMPGLVAYAARYEALTGALVGDCRTTRRSAPVVLGYDVSDVRASVVLALALCGRTDLDPVIRSLRRAQPDSTVLTHGWLPAIDGATALARRRPIEAIAALHDAARYDGAAESWPTYVRGLALLQAGEAADAEAAFARIVDQPGRALWFPLAPLSRLGIARARRLAGDNEGARRAYDQFFTTWKDADADLPVIVAARQEYARLP
ncbi:MAG: protein kinase [Acidobacteria bacterium]|nr:protein kinase [Acidobacteriota bacterium]